MDTLLRVLVLIFVNFEISNGENVFVQISASEHVNIVSDRFLSFTVDPKYLLDTDRIGKDCLCMAKTLSPAMLRIAGPSTGLMEFYNSTLRFNSSSKSEGRISVDVDTWKKFAEWSKQDDLELVFALNNMEKTASGLWDPHAALDILSAAQQTGLDNVVWQLGYECRNRSAEEYLNELETLRVMSDTFPGNHSWRVVAGDISGCLAADSKADFAEYVRVSGSMMDALFFNGNATAEQLERLSPAARETLLESISELPKPLWITEHADQLSELERAAEWLSSLGYSARNGFAVHFREMRRDELFEPTLSFYMSLLFKSLVGQRVLHVDLPGTTEATLFAHCTSLKRQPVPGAITLFGANMEHEAVRFSIKLSKREEGGDIMQFILTQDRNGNTIVNGLPMFHEGDIKPVVKRVRPYKTLIITLPPRSFGFWVLANTKIEACLNTNDISAPTFVAATTVDDIKEKMTLKQKEIQRTKRSAAFTNVILHKVVGDNEITKRKFSNSDEDFVSGVEELNDALEGIIDLQRLLNDVQKFTNVDSFLTNIVDEIKREFLSEEGSPLELHRTKRQTLAAKLHTAVSKLKNNTNLERPVAKPRVKVHPRLLKTRDQVKINDVKKEKSDEKYILNSTKTKLEELRRTLQSKRTELTEKAKTALKRHTRSINEIPKKFTTTMNKKPSNEIILIDNNVPSSKYFGRSPYTAVDLKERIKRGADNSDSSNTKLSTYVSKLEHLLLGEKNKDSDKSVMKMLRKIKEGLNIVPLIEVSDNDEFDNNDRKPTKIVKDNEITKDYPEDEAIEDQIIVKTKISDEDASISLNEKSNQQGFMKKAFEGITSIFGELSDKIGHLWTIMNAYG